MPGPKLETTQMLIMWKKQKQIKSATERNEQLTHTRKDESQMCQAEQIPDTKDCMIPFFDTQKR